MFMLAATRAFFILGLAASLSPAQDAQALFGKYCASCHQAGSDTRAPLPAALKLLSREKILEAVETGSMKEQASGLTPSQRLALASYLSGAPGVEPRSQAAVCIETKFSIGSGEAGWTGWGADLANTRFQPTRAAGLYWNRVSRLKLKWAFGFAGQSLAMAQPAVAGGRLFLGSADGTIYSLDA